MAEAKGVQACQEEGVQAETDGPAEAKAGAAVEKSVAVGHLCSLCYPGGVEIGEIAPGYTLIRYQGGYRILAGHGHADDILWHFIHDPEPDPDPRCESDDTGWLDRATEACTLDGRLLPMSAEDGYHFISTCVQAGYDRWTPDPDLHRLFSLWLFDRCGKLVKGSMQLLS